MGNNKKRIFFTRLHLYNLGCEAILRGSIKILREKIAPDLEFIIPSFYQHEDQEQLKDIAGLKIIPFSLWQRLKRKVLVKTNLLDSHWTPLFSLGILNPKDLLAVLSVGGDIYTFPNNHFPYDWVKLGDLCNSSQIPYIIWGATMEAFERQPEKLPYLVKHLQSCKLITPRDNWTTQYLEKHDVLENVFEVFDPAFCMDPIACDTEPFFPEKKSEYYIGVNLSPLSENLCQKSDLKAETVKAVERIIDKTGQSVVLIPHVFSPDQDPGYDDLSYHQEILNKISAKYLPQVGLVNRNIGAPRMKYLISNLAIYAGTRMHSTIAALSSEVPIIGLQYSQKAEALNDVIFDHRDWLLPIKDFNADSFSKKVIELLDKKDSVKERLKQQVPNIKKRSMAGGEQLKKILSIN